MGTDWTISQGGLTFFAVRDPAGFLWLSVAAVAAGTTPSFDHANLIARISLLGPHKKAEYEALRPDTREPRRMPSLHQDLTRTTLAVLFIGGLIAAILWVLLPFLPAIVWAITLVLSTWPLMLRVQRYASWPPPRGSLAVLVMTVVLLLIVIVPLWLAIATVVANLDQLTDWAREALSLHVPPPPEWLADLPLIGQRAAQAWAAATRCNRCDRFGAQAGALCRVYDAMVRWRSGQSRVVVPAVSSHRGDRRDPVRPG